MYKPLYVPIFLYSFVFGFQTCLYLFVDHTLFFFFTSEKSRKVIRWSNPDFPLSNENVCYFDQDKL